MRRAFAVRAAPVGIARAVLFADLGRTVAVRIRRAIAGRLPATDPVCPPALVLANIPRLAVPVRLTFAPPGLDRAAAHRPIGTDGIILAGLHAANLTAGTIGIGLAGLGRIQLAFARAQFTDFFRFAFAVRATSVDTTALRRSRGRPFTELSGGTVFAALTARKTFSVFVTDRFLETMLA